ncbi:AP-3 complex subunit mu-1 [Geodia barretti]|uniref:AP-3 complex subunit mu-1 n=2 Tax=Geodia barretti TaxID=519541 RepID=A0AA35TYD5_GEOBA|nr:AP-3 complex subunit mu-1 [Geodia barretti]
MMIKSLFMINKAGEVFMEKHWSSVVSRSVCDYFFEAQSKATSAADIPPVISTPHYYLVSIFRNHLYFVAVLQNEVPPLFVIEFLHRIVDVFMEYFGECSETKIKENYVTVYELLEEMLDNGYPLATESNVLKELIKPPSLVRSVVHTITGESKLANVSSTLPTGQLSNVPWRRTGVKYANNEIFLDLIEELDVIIDKSGTTIVAEVQGKIQANSRLSGMPDLTLSFMNPRLLDDVSFHPCVRYKRWESERVLSFIPPDGPFRLLSYQISSQSNVALPLYVTPQFSFSGGSGKFEVKVGPKQTMGKVVEDVKLVVPMPSCVTNVNPTSTYGMPSYDPVSRTVTWNIGKLQTQKYMSMNGSVTMTSGEAPESNPTIMVEFKISQLAVSGLKVSRLDIYGEKFKPFKE